MRRQLLMIALVGIQALAANLARAEDAGSLDQKKWKTRKIEGWTIHVDRKLIKDDKKSLGIALKLLSVQLKEITEVVPADAVKELKTVTLWFSPKYSNAPERAEYHPGAQWLKDNGRDAIMVKGVEFTNVRMFAAETRRMPNFALHELAHAYHDQVLSFKHKEVAAAYERAKAGGKYDRVLRQDSEGKKRHDRAYALTNPMEYFAESTESLFVKNDFQPFDKDELISHDPVMFKLLKRLWGVADESR
ncbi:MAG: hypothetical protein N2C14_14345 [Planctomycetales bacterium]